MKKHHFIDETTGDYNLKIQYTKYNRGFFLPVRGGDSGTQIDSLTWFNL